MRYAEVAVDAPTGWGRTFSYGIPPSLTVSAGHLVQAPFGPRYVHGIVFEVTASPQVEQTRDLIGLVEPVPLLSTTQLELARWVSNHYRASLFSAAAPMLPPGFRSQARPVVSLSVASLKEEPSEEAVTPQQRRVLDFLRRAEGAVEEARLARVLGQGALRAVASLVRRGLVERAWRWARPKVRPRYVAYLHLAPEAQGSTDLLKRRAPRQAQLLEALAAASGQELPLARTRREFGDSAVAGLRAKGLAQVTEVQQQRDPLAGQRVPYSPPPLPTEAQARALRSIHRALDDAQAHPRAFLLHGVTGSGKTEVYLQALAHCLDRGKKGLVLVPEIAMTPQTVQRFSARFPGRVAVLHSGLSPGEQFDQWWRIHEGAYDVVVGSRGAIFAPQPSLGLIVLDEEHEWTYKQHDAPPRYHARDVALRLGELTGAVVVLGTATPEVTTYYKAQQGGYGLLELPQRITALGADAGLAPVQIVDMRRELREGNRSIFSRALQEALKECLGAAGQAILFLNRRGAATVVQCRDCGHVLRCVSCAVPFTFHGPAPGYLLCHLCNRRRRPPQACPACEGTHIRYLGLGTQRVVEEVGWLLPGARVLRWDRDVATTHRAHEALLRRFSSGQADVMVGTQMVAKGLHIPAVTLVGVILADIGLNVPDFRAGERSFQVLCQVAGRAGRGPGGGRVVIQTYTSEHYAVVAAARQDYASFFHRELAYRREQGNPPFGRLIRLVYASSSGDACQREGQRLCGALRHQAAVWGMTDTDIIGPAPAYPERVRGLYRWHIILRGRDPLALLDRVPAPANWVVDVDPVSVV